MKQKFNDSNFIEKCGFLLLYLCIGVALLFLLVIIYFIFSRGVQIISWEFLTQPPRDAMKSGGIAPAILGTFYLTIGAIIVALPLGVASAIFLCEYSPDSYVVNIIRTGINNLAGVPSVIFGLFGLSIFVKFFGFGVSILSGSLTLGILILPGIISATQEALISVPQSLREASVALGATQWKTIKKIVLPTALPGILTGVILSIGRAAGETAPILFTAATFYTKNYPNSIFSETMALPYHIYALMTEGAFPQQQTKIAYGSALVLLTLVLAISAIAIYIREKQRKTYVY
ncbi:MAG: phosphate ABC transporter permease PstA [Bacteroidales bacterium]